MNRVFITGCPWSAVTATVQKRFLQTALQSSSPKKVAMDMSAIPRRPKVRSERARYPKMLLVLPILMAVVSTSAYLSRKYLFKTREEKRLDIQLDDGNYVNKVEAGLKERIKRQNAN